MNWTEKKKWINIALLGMCTLITPLASSMFAPGVSQVMAELDNSNPQLATFVVSVYVLGFAFGPLFIAPASEMYGRTICNICNALFVVFSICCGVSSSYGMLVAFRFLMGCAGSAPLTIGGGTIADMMQTERRGSAMAIWIMGPLLGPVIGPVAGGYLVEAKGWRWVFWLLAILGGAATILSFLCKQTGNMNLRSKLDNGLEHSEMLKRALVCPMKMLFSPIVFLLSLYMAVGYGILYVLTTFTFVFRQQYNFSEGNTGLTYIPLGIGLIFSMSVLGVASDRVIKAALARKETPTPKHRLLYVLIIPGGICLPIGLFIYGWTTQYHTHWAIPLFGTFWVGAGLNSCMMCINFYMVDAFTLHAASAIAANTILRSLAGALLPLGVLQMYAKIGLGCIALVLIPVPVLFKMYGPFLRTSGMAWADVFSLICKSPTYAATATATATVVLPNGLEAEMDDDIVREMVEGQDVGVEVSKVAALSSPVKPEWEMAVNGEEDIINSATQDDVCTEGYEVRFSTKYVPAFSAPAIGDHKNSSTPISSLRLVLPPAPFTHVAEGRATCQTLDEVRTSEYTGPPLVTWRHKVQEGVIGKQRLVDVELAYRMRIRASAANGADVDDLVKRLYPLGLLFKLSSDPYVQLVTTY
ncbi:hypothetical protein V502_04754 [Pseudogymnoascus sp. VKM F-4520 (FW-2644)]|nr:hypothetical protein V502_04754 [Pseudogymnoascus sp. VKM F-4520 (FW-2644)]